MSEIHQQTHSLQAALTEQTKNYLNEMKREDITDLYNMVIEQVEEPLFEAVMDYSKSNQSKAAEILGISRGTFRAKLKKHFDNKYCGSREEKEEKTN